MAFRDGHAQVRDLRSAGRVAAGAGLIVFAGLSVGALVALGLFHAARWGYLP